MKRLLCPDTLVSPSLTLTDKGSCFDSIWQYGAPIDTNQYDVSRLEFICETLPSGAMMDFALSDTGCIVVSERLKTALDDQHIDNIDYYPSTIIERDGDTPKTGYFAANILGLVDTIDLDKSEYRGKKRDGELRAITRIEKLVLKETETSHSSIYRVYMFRRLIVIEEKLCAFFTKNAVPGVRLVDPEKWDGIYGEVD